MLACYKTGSFLESCSVVDPRRGPGSDFGSTLETRLLGNRTRPGCSPRLVRSQLGSQPLRSKNINIPVRSN